MIIRPSDLTDNFMKLRTGSIQKKGLSTGFSHMDDNLKLAKSFMMIVTGYPSCGKSEWLDAVLINTTILYDWKVLYYSPENHPVEQHMSKLAEKYIGKPMVAFTKQESQDALEYLDKYYSWMYPEDPQLSTLLSFAQKEVDTRGLDILVIDPWNAVTHHRSGMLHEYLSEALSKIVKFSRDNKVLTCIVAHPTKPQKDKDGSIPVPNLYDISDGAMWRNKADYGIIVHRPDMSKNSVEVYIGKTKNKWQGKPGMVEFDYDYKSGRFKDKNVQEFLLPNAEESPF